MRKYLLIIAFALTTSFLQAQILSIPDTNFKAALLAHSPIIDLNNDKDIQVTEAFLVKDINVNQKFIKNLTGIEYFQSLTSLYCGNNELTTLDVSKNNALINLDCSSNQLTTLDLSNNTALTSLYFSNNELAKLDVHKNNTLNILDCSYNQLTTLNLSNNIALISLCILNQVQCN